MPKNSRKGPMSEVHRARISAGQCLRVLARVEEELQANWRTMDLAEIPALRLLVDIQFRKLAKVLPDLRALEVSGEVQVTQFRLSANPFASRPTLPETLEGEATRLDS